MSQTGQDTINFEAATQEHAIIEAIGLKNLTNVNTATAYGACKSSWGTNNIKFMAECYCLRLWKKLLWINHKYSNAMMSMYQDFSLETTICFWNPLVP